MIILGIISFQTDSSKLVGEQILFFNRNPSYWISRSAISTISISLMAISGIFFIPKSQAIGRPRRRNDLFVSLMKAKKKSYEHNYSNIRLTIQF